MFNITADHFISIIFMVGLAQLLWLFNILHKRGLRADRLFQALPPLFSTWVLMWPVYEQAVWLSLPLALLYLCLLCSSLSKRPFWRSMHIIFSAGDTQTTHMVSPMLSFTLALSFAGMIFQSIPEFGFGLALSVCLAYSWAQLMDQFKNFQLGFSLNPEQTLLGHIAFILSIAFLCSWSIHLYHGVNWQQLLIATLIAAMAASMLRATLPKALHQPICTLAIGCILWLL